MDNKNSKKSYINISTYKDLDLTEKISEIAFCADLECKQPFAKEKPNPLRGQKERFSIAHNLCQKLSRKLGRTFFSTVRTLLYSKKLTDEILFKTTLTLLLKEESVATVFLHDHQRKNDLFTSIQRAAKQAGIEEGFSRDPSSDLFQQLTWVSSLGASLFEDKRLFKFYLNLLSPKERTHYLFIILQEIQREPFTCQVEFQTEDNQYHNCFTSNYFGKTELIQCKEIPANYTFFKKRCQSHPNLQLGREKLCNQHLILESTHSQEEKKLLGGYCGNLENKKKVLEQLLFLLECRNEATIELKNEGNRDNRIQVYFTSFYSWHELDLIIAQKKAIDALDNKILCFQNQEGKKEEICLYLNHINFSFSNWPEPSQTHCTIDALNNEALIPLIAKILPNIECLQETANKITSIKTLCPDQSTDQFFKKKQLLNEVLEEFDQYKPAIIQALKTNPSLEAHCIKALLSGYLENKQKLQALDALLLLNVLLEKEGILHNKSSNLTAKLFAVRACDQAQAALTKIDALPYYPGHTTAYKHNLFELLYSAYLLLDEPTFNAALCGGFLTKEQYQEEILKDREISRHLSPWMEVVA